MVTIVACRHCAKPFKFLEGGAGDGVVDARDIYCPHCGEMHSWRVATGALEPSVLTDSEAKKYVAEQQQRRP